MGNICRSPTAHGVMRKLLEDEGEQGIALDSAGTHAYHVNEPPDPRAQEAALAREIDISDLRARAVDYPDFREFDLIVAMDRDNLARLEAIRQQLPGAKAQLALMLNYASDSDLDEVPDPYYGGADGFETVLDLLEDACRGLLRELRSS